MKKIITILIPVFIFCQCNKSEINIFFTGDVILDREVSDKIQIYGDTDLVNAINKFSNNNFLVINYGGTFTDSEISYSKKYNFKFSFFNKQTLNKMVLNWFILKGKQLT